MNNEQIKTIIIIINKRKKIKNKLKQRVNSIN